ncbi:MAG: septal ring lytic transglycosylase RlpA family protein [Dysgonamonadaceae bacterium]|jgi:rare lipoprotein A|nr:septal ring lytic transglycosylase RlpA family protein [Bacteroidales bacterium]HXL01396.1 septal ring lytic transglycosylase RlpA family protein [Dysgonamonadaceae bacterium]
MKKTVSFFIVFIAFIASSLSFPVFSQEKGKASFYAHKMQGRKTSSGEPYHSDSLTCAHRSYPFGTLLMVKNPKNEKMVVVKVTDRGPFKKNRLIDLSYAAAKQLGIIRQGIAEIELKEWEFSPTPPIQSFDIKKLALPVETTIDISKKLIATYLKNHRMNRSSALD